MRLALIVIVLVIAGYLMRDKFFPKKKEETAAPGPDQEPAPGTAPATTPEGMSEINKQINQVKDQVIEQVVNKSPLPDDVKEKVIDIVKKHPIMPLPPATKPVSSVSTSIKTAPAVAYNDRAKTPSKLAPFKSVIPASITKLSQIGIKRPALFKPRPI